MKAHRDIVHDRIGRILPKPGIGVIYSVLCRFFPRRRLVSGGRRRVAFGIALALMGSAAALIVHPHPVEAAKDPETPEAMYALALKQLKRNAYLRAIQLFEQIKLRYPLSRYAVLSELRLADAYFDKGDYLEAVDAYQAFIRAHPRHPELDYVVYRVALGEFRQAPSVAQRDQSATWRMLRAIDGNADLGLPAFEERFPDSEYVDDVKAMRKKGRTRLAKGIYGIGRYYYNRARFEWNRERLTAACSAAMGRFNQVLDEYPDVASVGAKALYLIGVCQIRLDRIDAAKATLKRFESRFPDSRLKPRLERLLSKRKAETHESRSESKEGTSMRKTPESSESAEAGALHPSEENSTG